VQTLRLAPKIIPECDAEIAKTVQREFFSAAIHIAAQLDQLIQGDGVLAEHGADDVRLDSDPIEMIACPSAAQVR
jgi:hypothetical protein